MGDLQFLVTQRGELYLFDPYSFMPRAHFARGGGGGAHRAGAALSRQGVFTRVPGAFGARVPGTARTLGYAMRRQRAELLSLALSAALYASGRPELVDAILCTHAVCELECLFS